MKKTRGISLCLILFLFVCYEYFAFPIDKNEAAIYKESTQILSAAQEKNALVVLTEEQTGRWRVFEVKKSLIFHRFQVMEEQKLDCPNYIAECVTPLVYFAYGIEDGTVTIYDPNWNPAILSYILIGFFGWRLLTDALKWYQCRKISP